MWTFDPFYVNPSWQKATTHLLFLPRILYMHGRISLLVQKYFPVTGNLKHKIMFTVTMSFFLINFSFGFYSIQVCKSVFTERTPPPFILFQIFFRTSMNKYPDWYKDYFSMTRNSKHKITFTISLSMRIFFACLFLFHTGM